MKKHLIILKRSMQLYIETYIFIFEDNNVFF